MLPYYVLIFSPFLFSLMKSKKTIREKEISNIRNVHVIGLFFLLYLALLVFRDISIGRDLSAYYSMFGSFSYLNWREVFDVSIEPAYVILNKVINYFTDDFQWVIVVTSVIIVVPIWITYKNEIEDPLLSISIFLILPTFVMFFSGLRQSIAIALGMVAYEMTKRRKWFLFLLLCILAMGFHRSAFMLFFMYPLYHAKITKKWLFLIVPVMIVIFIYNDQFFYLLSILISDYYEGTIKETGAYTMLLLFLMLGVFSFVIPDEKKMDKNTLGLRNFLLLSIILQMFVPLNALAMRMNYYYIIFIPLLIPKIIKHRAMLWNQMAIIARYVLLLYFLFYFFDHMPSGNILDTFPYKFFWEI